MIGGLKFSSDNSNISVILVQLSILFFFKLKLSWFLLWWIIFHWNMDILDIILWESGSHLNLLLQLISSETVQSGGVRMLLCYCPVGVEVQFPTWPLLISKGKNLFVSSEWSGSSGFPWRLSWDHPGWEGQGGQDTVAHVSFSDTTGTGLINARP